MGLKGDLVPSLESLIRGSRGRLVRSYLPFSEPPYRGNYPFKRPRVVNFDTNALFFLNSTINQNPALRVASPRSTNYLYEDRRVWHPSGSDAWPVSTFESNPRVTDSSVIDPDIWRRIHKPLKKIDWAGEAKKSWRLAPATTKWTWEDPYKMIICLKRKMRREVMNALGWAGKTGFKKPKYTQFSYVRCF